MPTPNTTPNSRTDVQYQEIKLFIEGVQIPFIQISVNSALGQLPQAYVSVPPQVGLLEISRFYNPKVHIFFLDPIDGLEKLLFSGIILSSSIQRTVDSSAITFTCAHKFQFLSDLLMDFSDWTSEQTNPNVQSDQAVKVNSISSKFAVQLALTGVFVPPDVLVGKLEVNAINVAAHLSKVSPQVLPAYLEDYANRIVGMPSVLLNLWNQIKQGSYMIAKENDMMVKLYIPLVEQGLQLFQRMAGHYYVESRIDKDRIDPCADAPSPEANNKPRLVPPCTRLFLRSSLQADIGAELIQSMIQQSGELTDLMSIYNKFLSSIDYEMLVLNSPAEIMKNPKIDDAGYFVGDSKDTYAVDMIVKPQLPFYFSPRCNVLYPSMVRSINVNQDDYNIPTRVTAKNVIRNLEGRGVDLYLRAPASIRDAIASATPSPNLLATLAGSHGKIGKFEQGRGVKAEKMNMPPWLSYLSYTQSRDISGNTQLPDPAKDPENYAAIKSLEVGWVKRYGEDKLVLNPWSVDSKLSAHQRILVAATDYYHAMTVFRSRTGQAETIFNPYMVVGYPMDILDSTPNHPSFHAYCTSITHNITATSITTSVGFVSAMTYTELANYYLPAVHPWLQVTLGLAESQSLVDYAMLPAADGSLTEAGTQPFGSEDPLDPSARGIADRFYVTTLATGAAAPSDLYNFNTGEVKPVSRQDYGLRPGSIKAGTGANGGEINPNLTGVGNLDLVYRNIEARDDIEERWDIKFIDLTPGNYNTNVIKISNEKLIDRDKLEPGQSIWLDYD